MRIAGMLSIAFALVLLPGPADAGEVKVGNVAVQLSPPSGYCAMDKNEVCYYGIIQNVTASGKNIRLLTLFASALRMHSMFFIYDVAPLDSTSVAATLAHLKSVYADFAKANPD